MVTIDMGLKEGGCCAPFAVSSKNSTNCLVLTAAFIPLYLFNGRQSRDCMSGVTHQNLIGYISAILLNRFTSGFHQNYLLFNGYKVRYNRKCLTLPVQFRNSQPKPLKLGRGSTPFWRGGLGPHLTQIRMGCGLHPYLSLIHISEPTRPY